MDTEYIRSIFPITSAEITRNEYGRELIYMDHAASTHAPKPVLDAYLSVMENTYSNVHRGEHELSCLSTKMFEGVAEKIGGFLGVDDLGNSGMQVVLTTNTTSSLDLASHVFSEMDGVVLTTFMEHHSNDLPHRKRGKVLHTEILGDGTLDMEDFENKLVNNDIKLVAVSAGSNVTGYMPDVYALARMAHDNGAKILVDAAQRMAHYPLDVKPLDHPEHLDFVAGAGHKMYAPFGSAFLLGTTDIFDQAPPYIPGGGTVAFVSDDDALYLKGVDRHQPGTPNIAGSIALGAAVDFLEEIGMEHIRKHELDLLEPLLEELPEIDGVTVYGDIPIDQKLGVVSFNIEGIRHSLVSKFLDKYAGIASRNGCFCAHPYLIRLLNIPPEESKSLRNRIAAGNDVKLPGAVRASLGIYNTRQEVDKLIETVKVVAEDKSPEILKKM